ncbi:HRP1 [Symbiodinium natans]|uniref:HRP1 protein n=1 Tax=Symbiodinium natans TaxID=878477 RepID=A0A812U5Y5_9DINO|nr:HRP1 [Symbiodinium natans]
MHVGPTAAGPARKMPDGGSKGFVKEGREDTIFVGGLRKSTTEDKVAGHFAKFGQVSNVEIKKQPDGTSRGFAFVTFAEKASVAKVLEAHSSHMIDNKWVDVKPQVAAVPKNPRDNVAAKKEKEEAKDTHDDYESGFAEKYLQAAAAMQQGSGASAFAEVQESSATKASSKMLEAGLKRMEGYSTRGILVAQSRIQAADCC